MKKEQARGFLYEKGFNMGFLSFVLKNTSNGQETKDVIFSEYSKGYSDIKNLQNIRGFLSGYTLVCSEETLNDPGKAQLYYNGFAKGKTVAREIFYAISGNENSFKVTTDTNKMRREKAFFKDRFKIIVSSSNLYHFMEKDSPNVEKGVTFLSIQRQLENYMRSIGKINEFNSALFSDKNPIDQVSRKGEFINCDNFLILEIKKSSGVEICPIFFDVSMYTGDEFCVINSAEDQVDLFSSHLSKLMFNLSLNNISVLSLSDSLPLNFRAISEYITRDKGTYKVTQAGSYAFSFMKYLRDKKVIEVDESGFFKNIKCLSIIGITNSGDTVINIQDPTLEKLEPFYDAYKSSDGYSIDALEKQRDSFYNSLKEIGFETKKEDGWEVHHKKIIGFNNTVDIRNVHGEKVNKALNDKDVALVYLEGAPGVGKTYNIKRNVRHKKGTILFYISSRKMVNQDFASKFVENEENPYIFLNKNFTMPKEQVLVKCRKDVFKKIEEIGSRLDPIVDIRMSPESKQSFIADKLGSESKSDGYFIREKGEYGVLNTISRLGSAIVFENCEHYSDDFSNIVVTLTTQACSKIGGLQFRNLMKGFINFSDDPEKNMKIKGKYNRLVFVVDEISGDESGIMVGNAIKELVLELREVFKDTDLDVKGIIADASIQSENMMNVYSSTSNIREAIHIEDNEENDTKCSYIEKSLYNTNSKEVHINTNCFPAKAINLSYKKLYLNNLRDGSYYGSLDKICFDTMNILSKNKNRQVLIFVQDKVAIDRLDQMFSVQGKNSIKITSSISEEEKEKMLDEIKDPSSGIEIIMVTSSASRGISFHYVTDLLIAVPNFKLPSNLMEIMQVIFRARGNDQRSKKEETNISFYLAYKGINSKSKKSLDKEDRDNLNNNYELIKSLETKSYADLLSLTCLLQGCLETRIFGQSELLGKKVVPLGPQGDKSDTPNSLVELNKSIRIIRSLCSDPERDKAVLNFCDAVSMCGVSVDIRNYEPIINFLTHLKDEAYNVFSSDQEVDDISFLHLYDCIIFKIEGAELNRIIESSKDKRKKKEFEKNCEYVSKLVYSRKEDRYRNAYKNIKNFMDQSFKLFDQNYNLNSKANALNLFICIPFHCFSGPNGWVKKASKNWTDLAYNGDPDNEIDVVTQMISLLSINWNIENITPLDSYHGFKDFPFVVFTSNDCLPVSVQKYNRTQVITSSRLNMLSLLFSKE